MLSLPYLKILANKQFSNNQLVKQNWALLLFEIGKGNSVLLNNAEHGITWKVIMN